MWYSKNKIKIFRLVIIIASVFFAAVVVVNFYQNISPTDENRYTNIQKRLIVKKPFTALSSSDNSKSLIDTVPVQSGIYKYNEEQIYNYYSMWAAGSKATTPPQLITINLHEATLDTFLLAAQDIPDTTHFYYVDAGARIVWIIPGGASDRAGLKQGDIILEVNGNKFKDVFEADSMLRNSRHHTIEYTVLSEGKIRTLSVKLAKYGVKISYLSMLISGLFCLGFGMFLALGRSKFAGARITGFALMLAGVLFATFITSSVVFQEFQIIKAILVLIGSSFVIPIFIHSNYYFPRNNEALQKRKWILIVTYSIAGLGSLLLLIGGFIVGDSLYINIVLVSIISLEILFSFIAYFITRKKIDPEIKRMNRFVNMGTILLLIIGIVNVFANILGWYQVNEYIFIGLLFFPLAYIYTVGRYRLYNIDLRIKRNFQYIFISVFWKLAIGAVGVYVVSYFLNMHIDLPNIHFTGTSVEVLEKPLRAPLQEYYEKIIFLALSLIMVYIVYKIGNAGLKYLDKVFNRTKLDFQKAYSKLMKMLDYNLKLNDLSEKLSYSIADIFQLKRAGFIIFKNENEVLSQHYYGLYEKSIREFIELTASSLYNSMEEYQGIMDTDYLPDSIREVLDECKFQYIVPIQTKGKIAALLIIGERLSESSFTSEDLEYFSALASQTAVALENAFLYEDLAQKERMKHELEIARKIQLASLPQITPTVEGLDISGSSIPALEVGGDFYDFLNGNSEDITIVVGDVSGKGTSAALYMSKAQGIMRTLYEFDLDPAELFVKTNKQLYGFIDRSSFISAIAVRVNSKSKSFKIARAGHLPLYHYSYAENKVSLIRPKGIALGMTGNLLFTENIIQTVHTYDFRDIMLFVTDGIIETLGESGDEYGEYRLIELIKANKDNSAHEIKETIINEVKKYSRSTTQFDDITVVVVKSV